MGKMKNSQTSSATLSWIKIILFLQILLLPTVAVGGQITLAWSQNTETDLAGYRIFCRESSNSYTFANPFWTGTATQVTINNLKDDTDYYFLVKAYTKSGIESLSSNEVYFHTPAVSSSDDDNASDQEPDTSGDDASDSQTDDQDSSGSNSDDSGGSSWTVCESCNNVELQVSDGNDDAEEQGSGYMYLNSTDLELVYDSINQSVGIRFQKVSIPTGAVIKHAHLQFQTDEENSSATSLNISGEAIDNAPAFTSASYNISQRSRTSAAVNWQPEAWETLWEAGSKQRTPELSTVVQEIVDRSGWSSGNALAFIITGTGERGAESYEGSPAGAPLLYVEYLTPEDNQGSTTSDNTGTSTSDNDDDIQNNVMSVALTDGKQLIVSVPDGIIISRLEIKDNPSDLNLPPVDLEFAYGLVNLAITTVDSNGSAVVTLSFPEDASPETYYKYGPTPDNPENHWYEFSYDGETGAQIEGNVIKLHFVDGKRGDANLDTTDNKISDSVGGAVFRNSQSVAIETDATTDAEDNGTNDGGGKGGCFIQSIPLSQTNILKIW